MLQMAVIIQLIAVIPQLMQHIKLLEAENKKLSAH